MTHQSSNQRPPMIRIGLSSGGLTGESVGNAQSTILRLLQYLTPYRSQLVVVTVLVIFTTAFNLMGPILLGQAIDDYVIPRDVSGLTRLSGLMLAVYIGAGLCAIAQGLLMVSIGQGLVADLRSEIFSHLQMLSMAYYDRHPVGDLMSRVTNDTEAINRTLSNGLIEFTTNILLFGCIIIAMFVLNWPLALGTALILPVMVFITMQVSRISRKAFRGMQRSLGKLNAIMEETISGLRVVQAFTREGKTLAQFQETNVTYRQEGIKADIITAALGPLFTTMSILTIAATSLLGGWLALQGLVEVGVIVTFVVYIMNFFRPMRTIAMLYNQLQAALAGAERIFTVLDEQPRVQDEVNAPLLQDIQGHVQFKQVRFAYEAEKPVLSDVSLEALPGQTIALVGPTGAGKTTIISLLSRFYDINEGTICIDGQNIKAVQQASLRKQLGIVLQDTFLFSGTVMDNIRYGRLTASDEEARAAAKLANADRFIRLLPQGYQTQVSEKGHNFSQGQRQLLAIARAILADPRILILDEATSSVDTRTEIQLQEALLRLMEGRTSFVIAHRLSTIRNADQVLVVNDQRIIERGTHEELLALGGFYDQLYRSQYGRVEMVQ